MGDALREVGQIGMILGVVIVVIGIVVIVIGTTLQRRDKTRKPSGKLDFTSMQDEREPTKQAQDE